MLAWKIEPTLKSPGRIFWCNSNGGFLSCFTTKDNSDDGRWNVASKFDELMSKYDEESNKIKCGENNSIEIRKENESDITNKISNNKNISDIVKLRTTSVGRIYLE